MPERVGRFLVREAELVDETRKRTCLVDGVEILALKVLDQGDRERFAITECAHDRGDSIDSRLPCRPQTTFASDQPVPASVPGPDDDGLNHTLCGD